MCSQLGIALQLRESPFLTQHEYHKEVAGCVQQQQREKADDPCLLAEDEYVAALHRGHVARAARVGRHVCRLQVLA